MDLPMYQYDFTSAKKPRTIVSTRRGTAATMWPALDTSPDASAMTISMPTPMISGSIA